MEKYHQIFREGFLDRVKSALGHLAVEPTIPKDIPSYDSEGRMIDFYDATHHEIIGEIPELPEGWRRDGT